MFKNIFAAIIGLVISTGLGLHPAAAATNFNGLWAGTWSSVQGSGGLEMIITQSGTNLSGQFTAQNTNECGMLLVVPLTGTVSADGNTAIFSDILFNDPCIVEQEKISLTANRSGNTLNGNFTTQFYENGTWNTGVSGSFSLNRICCTISSSAGTGGSIDPSGILEVAPGSNMTFSITAGAGFAIGDVIVDGASIGVQSSYTFTNIIADHIISAIFAKSLNKQMPFLHLLLDEE
jgi:hypothetical protein